MKELKSYLPVFEMARPKGSKNKPKEWPENAAQIEKDPEIKNATPADEVDVKKVEPVGPVNVTPGTDADKNGTKGVWDVDSPNPKWEEELAKLDIDALDDNAYELSERFDDKHDFLVLGEAGWAKTSVITAMAKKHGYHVLTVYLDKAVASDLGGIPVPAEDKKTGALYMNYSVPGWALYMAQHPNDKFLLFFDEMNQAAPDVLNALMPIVLNHVVCGIKFPNMIVGAAGNLASENASLSDLNKPLRDRFKPIIKWEVHTPETWKSAFEYLHQTFDSKIGKEIVDKFEEMQDYWNSPRDITRVIFEFVAANNGRETRKYSRVKSIVGKLEQIVWDDLDDSIANSRKYERDMEELANMISDLVRNGLKKKEEEPANNEDEEPLSDEEIKAREIDVKNIIDALVRGYYTVSANEGVEGKYLCTVDNVVTCLFDPDSTGVTAEVLRKLIKKMKADGKTPKYNTVDEGREDAKSKGWDVPEYKDGAIYVNGEKVQGYRIPKHSVKHLVKPVAHKKQEVHSND